MRVGPIPRPIRFDRRHLEFLLADPQHVRLRPQARRVHHTCRNRPANRSDTGDRKHELVLATPSAAAPR